MKRSRIIVTVLSVFCILLIGITSFNSGFLAPLRNGAGIFLVPMERGVNALGGGIYHHARDLAELRRVQEENRRLTERVGALTEENTRLSSEVYELARLRELYELDQEYLQYPKVAARVIARDSGNWFRIFRIDKGTKDGIRPDMNVMVNGGLIGIVTDVGLNYATVRTIIDDSSNVSGMSQRTGDICNVAGDMELYEQGRLGLDHIRKESDIESGDRIVTSNISEVYLPGILIGYAENVVTDANNITKSGALIPAGTFEGLQEVLVITQLKNELQIGDEAAEEAPEDHNDTPDEIETESEEEESEETEE